MKKTHIIIGVVLIVTVTLLVNYQRFFKALLPPVPEITYLNADGTSSSLFNYSIKVKGNVINKGGDGYIVLRATVFQEDKKYIKTKQIHLPSYETDQFKFVFDEVKLLKEKPSYNVEAFVLGTLND